MIGGAVTLVVVSVLVWLIVLNTRACPGCGHASNGVCGFCSLARTFVPALDQRLRDGGH